MLRIQYGPGEKSVMHGHPADVAVFLTGGGARKEGSRHLPQDTGDQPFEVIVVELK